MNAVPQLKQIRTSYVDRPYDGHVGIDHKTEIVVTIPGGFLVFPSAEAEPEGCSYVRFVDAYGVEQVYYDSQEWVEDPKVVMGAIMAHIQNGPDSMYLGPDDVEED